MNPSFYNANYWFPTEYLETSKSRQIGENDKQIAPVWLPRNIRELFSSSEIENLNLTPAMKIDQHLQSVYQEKTMKEK